MYSEVYVRSRTSNSHKYKPKCVNILVSFFDLHNTEKFFKLAKTIVYLNLKCKYDFGRMNLVSGHIHILIRTRSRASASIGAWEVKLEIMIDRPTEQLTDRQTDRRAHRNVSLPKNEVKR